MDYRYFILYILKLSANDGYTYLGTINSPTSKFTMELDHLKDRDLYALFGLRKHTNISRLGPFLASKLFWHDYLSNFDIYNSAIWGVYAKPDFKSHSPRMSRIGRHSKNSNFFI